MSDIVMADFGGNMNKNTKIEIENMDIEKKLSTKK